MSGKDFTDEKLIEILRDGLWPQYQKYPAIQSMFEFEDLVQDCALGFYERMKSTGEIRIEHYRKMYDYKHLCNMVKFMTYQAVPNYLRCNEAKYFPYSLNRPMKNDEESEKEFIDMIPALDENLLLQAEEKEILSIFKEEEKNILQDLLAGYTKTALRDKYKRFDYILDDIRKSIAAYYCKSHQQVPDVVMNYLDKLYGVDQQVTLDEANELFDSYKKLS